MVWKFCHSSFFIICYAHFATSLTSQHSTHPPTSGIFSISVVKWVWTLPLTNFQKIVKFVQFSFFEKKKMRKWGWSRSVLHRTRFYAKWNNVLLVKAIFLQVTQNEVHLSVHEYEHKVVSESIDFEDTNLSTVGFAEYSE